MVSPFEVGLEFGQHRFPSKKKKESKKPKRSKEWRKLRRKWEKETKVEDWNPQEKIPPVKVHQSITLHELEQPPWKKIKFEGETFHAAEVVILVKGTPETDLKLFISEMRNVRMYQDARGGLLIRPVRASIDSVLALASGNTKGSATEAAAGSSDGKDKRSRNVPVVLKGKHNLNPAAEGSKRFFLMESMLEGGTCREIVDRGALLWSKATKKPKEKFGMVATPSNIREVYGILVDKLSKVGKSLVVKEDNGTFKISDS